MLSENKLLWVPSEYLKQSSNLHLYIQWLGKESGYLFKDYESLWNWSVTEPAAFWDSIWKYFSIIHSGSYSEVLQKPPFGMIGTKWFSGVSVSYTEHIFRNRTDEFPAIVFQSETKSLLEISWSQLEHDVSRIAAWLKTKGVKAGDRVCAVLPNIPETVMIFLAANSIGAIWSSCSPDFGVSSIRDRFEQIAPKVLFFSDGYTYNGKPFDKIPAMLELKKHLSGLDHLVLVPYLNEEIQVPGTVSLKEILRAPAQSVSFTRMPFDSPMWILYSSGTTGKPKAITHSAGGCLLEHLKAITLHQDVKPGEKYFWYSTTGWMMWNYSLASLLAGTTLVIYEGSASYPDLKVLWSYAREAGINHFGGGAAFYIACMKAGLQFSENSFPELRTIGSTGSPLPSETFEWIYQHIKKDVWLISLSGGTDICSCFVGGNPLLPVYAGEIQCRLLGCALQALDEKGIPVRDELGEMVITEPMPSMPVFFWNDEGNKRYFSSYFENYPGIWRHGDWISVTSKGSVIIYGRSDATLNRDGVRIGTSEIYSSVESNPEVADSLVVCVEEKGGRFFMPLFVVLREGIILNDNLKKNINSKLRSQYSPRHVPDAIFQVTAIPYTLSGKKMEAPVKKILMGTDPEHAALADTMKNPGVLNQFLPFRRPA